MSVIGMTPKTRRMLNSKRHDKDSAKIRFSKQKANKFAFSSGRILCKSSGIQNKTRSFFDSQDVDYLRYKVSKRELFFKDRTL